MSNRDFDDLHDTTFIQCQEILWLIFILRDSVDSSVVTLYHVMLLLWSNWQPYGPPFAEWSVWTRTTTQMFYCL